MTNILFTFWNFSDKDKISINNVWGVNVFWKGEMCSHIWDNKKWQIYCLHFKNFQKKTKYQWTMHGEEYWGVAIFYFTILENYIHRVKKGDKKNLLGLIWKLNEKNNFDKLIWSKKVDLDSMLELVTQSFTRRNIYPNKQARLVFLNITRP